MKKSSLFLTVFAIASASNVVAGYAGLPTLAMVSKPAIILSLIGYYALGSIRCQRVFIAALGACLVGDVALLFQDNGNIFFIVGLLAFLIAHLLLITTWRRNRSEDAKDALANIQKIRLSFPILLAGMGLVFFLYPHLGNFRMPVIAYACVLVTMVLSALYRFGRTDLKSFWMAFGGAVLFMISDSVLAINKFGPAVDHADAWIMLTYCLAMILIVRGVMAHESAVD